MAYTTSGSAVTKKSVSKLVNVSFPRQPAKLTGNAKGSYANESTVTEKLGRTSGKASCKQEPPKSGDTTDSEYDYEYEDEDDDRRQADTQVSADRSNGSLFRGGGGRARTRSRSPIARAVEKCATDIWIIAGDDALHPGFTEEVREQADALGWTVDRVKLPSDLVLHTGVALSQVLLHLDYDCKYVAPRTRLHCVVSECKLKAWPKTQQATFYNRIDNVNHCLRAFGVDGASTKLVNASSREALLRSSLKNFVMLGDGPVGRIDIESYRKRLTLRGKRALTDDNLMEELVFAQGKGSKAPNGVWLQYAKKQEAKYLFELIVDESGTGKNVVLLVLDPRGRPLWPSR